VIFLLFALGVASSLFVGSLFMLELGRRLGARRLDRVGNGAMSGLNAVEGAVFALMGLLLAFAISGALQRFDERRQLILQEANAIGTAYARTDLLPQEARAKAAAALKSYLSARLDLYRQPIAFSIWEDGEQYSLEHQEKVLVLQSGIWDLAVAECQKTSSTTACTLLLPALNNVFEAARLRLGAAERHPPQIIFVMLFSLGLGGSLLAGFGMAAAKTRSLVHMVVFALALSVALFVITDIEFPRLGLIRVDQFDHFLDDVYGQMR
jgi:hypothetical protein